MDRSQNQMKLTDGRILGYGEFGDPEGKPIFYFHGHPGSRVDWPGFADPEDSAAKLGARVIAADRPGHGLSDFKPGRKILDWPDDVVELADSLEIDRFAVLGCSGGGPYAAACAFKIPERLAATAIVSGMGPVDAPGATAGESWTYPGKGSLLRRLILMLTAMGVRKDPEQFLTKMEESLEGPDKALSLHRPELIKGIVDTFAEALRPGIAGAHYEAGLYTRDWGFRLEDVSAEVHLWHGEQDPNVLISVARYVADAIPNCHATFLEDEGHITLMSGHTEEILRTLVSRATT